MNLSVDQEARTRLSKKVVQKDDFFSKESTHIYQSKRELTNGRDKEPIHKLRLSCFSRGATGILRLARTFRNMDNGGSEALNLEEFTKGIRDTGLDCCDDDIKNMFASFDHNGSGTISFSKFLLKLRPQMPQYRLDIIEKAFKKVNRTGSNVITLDDLKKIYCVRYDPKYLSGELTEDEMLAQFLKNFEGGSGKVTKEDFENYYASISASIDNDAYFDLIMRHAYKL